MDHSLFAALSARVSAASSPGESSLMAPTDTNGDHNSESVNDVNVIATSEEVHYRGVRKRSSGRYAAAISDPTIKKRRWLGTFKTSEEAAKAYDKAARRLKGGRAKTNFPIPDSVQNKDHTTTAVGVQNQRRSSNPSTILPATSFNHNMMSLRSAFCNVKPWSYVNKAVTMHGVGHRSMNLSSNIVATETPIHIPSNLLDGATLLQLQRSLQATQLRHMLQQPPRPRLPLPMEVPLSRENVRSDMMKTQKGYDLLHMLQLQQQRWRPMEVPLSRENVRSDMMKTQKGYELLEVGAVNNVLSAAMQTSVCQSSSSSGVVDTQLSVRFPQVPRFNPGQDYVPLRAGRFIDLNLPEPGQDYVPVRAGQFIDLNLPEPGEEENKDEHSPSLTLSLGLNFMKNSYI